MTIEDAIRRYLAALDACREVEPHRWLNLKGAARQRTAAKRERELEQAENALRVHCAEAINARAKVTP